MPKKEKATKPKEKEVVKIPAMDIQVFRFRLVGDSPLICHQFPAKVRDRISSKQQGEAQPEKKPLDPRQDYLDSLYPMPDGDGYGFPAQAFKLAAVEACTSVREMTKIKASQAFQMMGDLVKIHGEPEMRCDTVRVNKAGVPRYRGAFNEWYVDVDVRLNVRVLTKAELLNLLNVAGFAVGVGEWRPQRKGNKGMFHVE